MELHLYEPSYDTRAGVSHNLEVVIQRAEGRVEETGGLGEARPVLLGGAGVMDGEQLGVEEEIFQLGSHVGQEGRNHQVHA